MDLSECSEDPCGVFNPGPIKVERVCLLVAITPVAERAQTVGAAPGIAETLAADFAQ